MIVQCVWEHNGSDSLLYAAEFPGAYTRGPDLQTALRKMPAEISSYLPWAGVTAPEDVQVEILQDVSCELNVCDADSDVLFETEKPALTQAEYLYLKGLALKSAADFLSLYQSVPDVSCSSAPVRQTFYGLVPRTAEQMYLHTKGVTAYYFGEIGVAADNDGSILECRSRGFQSLEKLPDFLGNTLFDGSYGELWNLRKVMRRFIWHDRIHAKAMWRMANRTFGPGAVPDLFCFGE